LKGEPVDRETLAQLHVSYNAREAATWKEGESVPYEFLVSAFSKIELTKKRLEIARYLTECYRTILATSPQDMLPAIYLCVNKLAPSHEGLELGIGDSTIMRAISSVSGGKNAAEIKRLYNKEGDLGSVAMSLKSKQNLLMDFRRLTIPEVFNKFKEIARETGSKSQDRKKAAMEYLLSAAKGSEVEFIVKSLQVTHLIYTEDTTVGRREGQTAHWTGRSDRPSGYRPCFLSARREAFRSTNGPPEHGTCS